MKKETPLTDRIAAGVLLQSLVFENVPPEAKSIILAQLCPGDMFQVEYMLILEAAQNLQNQEKPITISSLEAELLPEDPAGFAKLVLRGLHEDRQSAPTDVNEIRELVNFLVSFRKMK